jgi:hypothetical protein
VWLGLELDWQIYLNDPANWATPEPADKPHLSGFEQNHRMACQLECQCKHTVFLFKKYHHLLFPLLRHPSKTQCKQRRQYEANCRQAAAEAAAKAKREAETQAKPFFNQLTKKEREQQEWDDWFYSVEWADEQEADPNYDPYAYIEKNSKLSADLFQRFMDDKYSKFYFELINGLHPYKPEEADPNEAPSRTTTLLEDLFTVKSTSWILFDCVIYQ